MMTGHLLVLPPYVFLGQKVTDRRCLTMTPLHDVNFLSFGSRFGSQSDFRRVTIKNFSDLAPKIERLKFF